MRLVIVESIPKLDKEFIEKLEQQHIVMRFTKNGQVPCDTEDVEQVSECARLILDMWDGVDALIVYAKNWETVIKAFYPIMDQTEHPTIVCVTDAGYTVPESVWEFAEKNPRLNIVIVDFAHCSVGVIEAAIVSPQTYDIGAL